LCALFGTKRKDTAMIKKAVPRIPIGNNKRAGLKAGFGQKQPVG